MRPGPSPRQVLEQATTTNIELGHENLGSLSRARGFLPTNPPLLELPTSHRAWDDAASELPELYASLQLRARLLAIPELDTSADSLPDRYLQRAATELPAEISTLRAGDAVRLAETAAKPLYAALESSIAHEDPDVLRRIDGCCSALEAADRRLQDDLVSALRSGLELFETHQAATVRAAGTELLGALLGLPHLLAEHAIRVRDGLSMLSSAVARQGRGSGTT
jgi:hypothetical protein